MEPRFLAVTPAYHELMLLLTIHRLGPLPMPLDQNTLPAVAQQVPLARLLNEGIMALSGGPRGQTLSLTPQGQAWLRRMLIDYHLELMEFRQLANDFMAERVKRLEEKGCRDVLLYGASDTARVLLGSLASSKINVVAVIDDDPDKDGTTMEGVAVCSPEAAKALAFDSVVVTTVEFEDHLLRTRADFFPPTAQLMGLFDDFDMTGSAS